MMDGEISKQHLWLYASYSRKNKRNSLRLDMKLFKSQPHCVCSMTNQVHFHRHFQTRLSE